MQFIDAIGGLVEKIILTTLLFIGAISYGSTQDWFLDVFEKSEEKIASSNSDERMQYFREKFDELLISSEYDKFKVEHFLKKYLQKYRSQEVLNLTWYLSDISRKSFHSTKLQMNIEYVTRALRIKFLLISTALKNNIISEEQVLRILYTPDEINFTLSNIEQIPANVVPYFFFSIKNKIHVDAKLAFLAKQNGVSVGSYIGSRLTQDQATSFIRFAIERTKKIFQTKQNYNFGLVSNLILPNNRLLADLTNAVFSEQQAHVYLNELMYKNKSDEVLYFLITQDLLFSSRLSLAPLEESTSNLKDELKNLFAHFDQRWFFLESIFSIDFIEELDQVENHPIIQVCRNELSFGFPAYNVQSLTCLFILKSLPSLKNDLKKYYAITNIGQITQFNLFSKKRNEVKGNFTWEKLFKFLELRYLVPISFDHSLDKLEYRKQILIYQMKLSEVQLNLIKDYYEHWNQDFLSFKEKMEGVDLFKSDEVKSVGMDSFDLTTKNILLFPGIYFCSRECKIDFGNSIVKSHPLTSLKSTMYVTQRGDKIYRGHYGITLRGLSFGDLWIQTGLESTHVQSSVINYHKQKANSGSNAQFELFPYMEKECVNRYYNLGKLCVEENWVYKSHQPRLVSSPQSGADGKSGEDGVSGGALKLTYIDQSQRTTGFILFISNPGDGGSGQKGGDGGSGGMNCHATPQLSCEDVPKAAQGKDGSPGLSGKSGSVEIINHNGSNEFSELIIDMSTKAIQGSNL